jgi:hypothetical protein
VRACVRVSDEWSHWLRSVAPLQLPDLFALYLSSLAALPPSAPALHTHWVQSWTHFLVHCTVREPNARALSDGCAKAMRELMAPALKPILVSSLPLFPCLLWSAF